MTIWKRGDKAFYYNAEVDIALPVTILKEVEGWWLIRCSDDSEAIVRPSRLINQESYNAIRYSFAY